MYRSEVSVGQCVFTWLNVIIVEEIQIIYTTKRTDKTVCGEIQNNNNIMFVGTSIYTSC